MIAADNSRRLFQEPRSRTFFCTRAKKDSIAAVTIHLSNQPGALHKVKSPSISPLRTDMSSWGFFEAHQVCEPFSYLDSELIAHTLTASGQVTNPGLLDAVPIITIKGTGAMTLTVNAATYRVQSPAGQIPWTRHKFNFNSSFRGTCTRFCGLLVRCLRSIQR